MGQWVAIARGLGDGARCVGKPTYKTHQENSFGRLPVFIPVEGFLRGTHYTLLNSECCERC